MTTVVTGWTGRGYDSLGEQFVRTFKEHWPRGVELLTWQDRDGTDSLPGYSEFLARHKDNKVAHGRVPQMRWRHSERVAGYSYRSDAVKFATQLFIPEAAAKHLPDGEILVWFDADVVTHRPVPECFVESLIGDADITYLGRRDAHSEIGFWAVRLSPKTREFLSAMPNLYRTDRIFELAETHSAFVFDHVRKQSWLKENNLTPKGYAHVWRQSPLQRYMEHLKGKRKWGKRAPERQAA